MIRSSCLTSVFLILIIAVLCSACRNQATANTNLSSELLELEWKAIEREFQNDTTFLSSLMDETFIELSGPAIKNKHDVLKAIYLDNVSNKNNGIVRDSFEMNEPVVHIYDDAAVVTFIMKTYNRKQDSSFVRNTRFYDVWVRRNHQWKAVT